jgi:hypothetical protein
MSKVRNLDKTNLINLGYRIFTHQDQFNFAEFSNDFNPIHLDKKYARKTLPGTAIVHGLHAVLWSIELFLTKFRYMHTEYKVHFHKYIKEDSKVNLYWDVKNNKLLIKNLDDLNLVTILCINQSSVDNINTKSYKINNSHSVQGPEEIDIQKINIGEKFSALYSGNKNIIKKVFPILSEKLNHEIIKEIALLSFIVGMKIPGLNSLLVSVNFSISLPNQNQTLLIKSINKDFNFIKTEYQGKNVTSTLEAFFRPKPIKPMSCNEIFDLKIILPDLKNQSVLVVGGSRGLGAITSKLLACAGAKVTLSYKYGQQEAMAVAEDIISIGKSCKVVQHTVSVSQTYEKFNDKYDQLYYFPTNKIFYDDGISNNERYDSFHEIYVDCFKNLVENLIKKSKIKKIFYPSTIAIDKPIDSLKDYIKAKKEGERICRLLQKKFMIKVLCPRLGRILTDQTNTMVPANFDHPVDTMLMFIKLMSSN